MVRLLRRLFRLGVLAGVGVGIVKVVKGRKAPDPWADSWVSTGPPGGTKPAAAPIATPSGAAEADGEQAESTGGEDSEEPHRAGAKAKSDESSGKGSASRGRAAKPTGKGPARKSPTGKAEEPPGERLWVPANEGVCPPSHPVKAKLSSKIFHIPGGRNYKTTKADRCYPDEASAQADGLRPALR